MRFQINWKDSLFINILQITLNYLNKTKKWLSKNIYYMILNSIFTKYLLKHYLEKCYNYQVEKLDLKKSLYCQLLAPVVNSQIHYCKIKSLMNLHPL